MLNICHFFWFLSLFIFFASSSKLNVRRVLLPYNIGVPTNFTLKVDDGCYQWTSSRLDVIYVTPIYPTSIRDPSKSCSTSAVVGVVSRSPKRLSSIVIAKDINAGTTHRVDVDVDVIRDISIITTTKEIALDDIPEVISIQARNDENDTFSSLGGIEFEWILEPITIDQHYGANNIRFKKFSESSYELTSDIEYWDSRDSHGPTVLIQGTKTGVSKVRARIKDPIYSNVQPAEITLIVIANLLLKPSHNIYLIPFAKIKYAVEIIKSSESKNLPMPSDQYYLELSNLEVASLDKDTSTVTGLAEGQTDFILKDRNIKLGDGIRQPTTEIFVRKPSYMTISVLPGENWALQENSRYDIIFQIYDNYHHQIYRSDNLDMQVTFPPKHFNVIFSTQNSTFHSVRTLIPGTCFIKARLNGASQNDGSVVYLENPVDLEQEIKIYPILKVSPRSILLPWDDIVKPKYTVYASASGATGFYLWESTNSSVASVSFVADSKESSKATIETYIKGDASLIVMDVHNSVFNDELKISIGLVVDIEILPSILETTLGKSLSLPLALYGYDPKKNFKRVFDDCSQIPLIVEVVEKNRFKYIETEGSKLGGTGSSCRSLEFMCDAVGYSRIFVKYIRENEEKEIVTTVIISCHFPLKLINPVPYGLLVLGTSVEVAFEGGPRFWPIHKEGHYTSIIADKKGIVDTMLVTDPYRFKKDLHVFRVICKEIGQIELVLEVGNTKSASLLNPAKEKASVTIICDNPVSLHLMPKLKSDEDCPLGSSISSSQSTKIPISNSRNSHIEIYAKDKENRKFLNISSLLITWQLSDYSLAKLSSNKYFFEEENGSLGFRKWIRNYQILEPLKVEGTIDIKAIATNYRKEFLFKEGINVYRDLTSELKATAAVTLTEKPIVVPNELSVFNHPKNEIKFEILKGSGHFKIDSSNMFANVTYVENLKQILLVPFANGIFSIKINDICVDHGIGIADAIANVKVVNPKSITLSMVNKIELNKEVQVKVQVLDSRGSLIPAIYHRLMNLEPIISSDAISIKIGKEPIHGDKFSSYWVKGEKLSKANFKLISKLKDKSTISSQSVNIQVFNPLSIVPSNLSLVVGAVFQINIVGGPSPDVSIVYHVEDEKIIEIDTSGIIIAKRRGSTGLTARAVGLNEETYSQYRVIVDVVALDAISIIAPSKHLLIGHEIPLRLVGMSKSKRLSPFSFGSTIPPFIIEWSASNKDAVDLRSIYDQIGLVEGVTGNNLFAMRVYGKQAGLVTVKVKVNVKENKSSEFTQTTRNIQLSDEIQLRIYPPIELQLPPGSKYSNIILLSPGSEIALQTNRKGFAKVSYSLQYSNSKITLEKGNILKGEDIDENILHVLVTEDFGLQQVLSYRVVVKALSHLMLTPKRNVHLIDGSSIQIIPNGMSLAYDVEYFDSNGLRFDGVVPHLKISLSRNDLISIISSSQGDNNTLIVKTLKEGRSILRAWDSAFKSNENLNDFVHLQVGQVIEPKGEIQLMVGDCVCWKCPLVGENGRLGKWSVDNNDNVFELDPNSGVGIAIKKGKSRIRYGLNDWHTLSELVNVRQPKRIELHHIGSSGLNGNGGKILIRIERIDQNEGNFQNFGCNECEESLEMNKYFRCDIYFNSIVPLGLNALLGREMVTNDLFNCSIKYADFLQSYVADIVTVKTNEVLKSVLSAFETNITIMVTMIGMEGEEMASALSVSYWPPFTVQNPEIIIEQEGKGYIIIVATNEVWNSLKAINTDEESQKLNFIKSDLKESDGLLVGNIEVLLNDNNEFRERFNVKIWSGLTLQSVDCLIKVRREIKDCIQTRREKWGPRWLNDYYSLFVTLGALLIAAYLFGQRPQRPQRPTPITRPPTSLTSTPISSQRILNYNSNTPQNTSSGSPSRIQLWSLS